MNDGAKIMIFLVAALAFLGVSAILASALFGASAGDILGDSKPSYKVHCNGEIEVAYAVGESELAPPSCNLEKCGVLSKTYSLVPGFLQETGSVHLVVDGKVVDTAKWESTLGKNQQYTLDSACVPEPENIVIKLRNDANHVVDEEEVNS